MNDAAVVHVRLLRRSLSHSHYRCDDEDTTSLSISLAAADRRRRQQLTNEHHQRVNGAESYMKAEMRTSLSMGVCLTSSLTLTGSL